MAKVEIMLKKWQTLKDGTHPIIMRVAKNESRKIFATGMSTIPKYWNDEFGQFINDKRLERDYAVLNDVLTNIKAKANKIISEFERLGIDFTITQFENEFEKKTVTLKPSDYFDSHIEKLTKDKKYGYADVFRSTLKILQIFDKKFHKIKFPDIDKKYIVKFDSFLRNDRGLKDTSISVYMRTLRTLLNAAITDDLMNPGAYPFSRTLDKKGYKMSELNTETKKRFIPVEYLQTLKNYQFDDLRLETARNLFMLSFYCRGLNWVDMALLTKENIFPDITESGKQVTVLKYERAKTHKEYQIIVNPDIQELLNWFKDMPHFGTYLLPIITMPEHTGEALRLHIKDRRSKYNHALTAITEKLEFPEALQKMTSYFSRHSYAMAMRSKGINIELIQESLGHSDLSTTKIYLDSFGREAVADASENLI